MKKNISINISGIIFHIEEDGYDTLKKYLDSINRYFSTFEDSSEILADIESRIAEIFLSKLHEEKQVITLEDVQALVATMGSVSDFKAAEENESDAATGGATQEKAQPNSAPNEQSSSSGSSQSFAPNFNPSRRLFRDQRRKILGGVCSGLGSYMNIDPLWIRLMFAILFFAWGLTFFIYIIMWIVVPGSFDLDEPVTGKKMFRDPGSKVIGGVSGGVAAFFNIDIVAVRVLFILLIFAGGLGILIYVVMWIVLPEARTLTDRVQMQGEPVTLSNIETELKRDQTVRPVDDESTLTKILLFPFRLLGMILTAVGKILVPIIDIIRVAVGIAIVLLGLALVFCIVVTSGILFGLFTASAFSLPWMGEFNEGSIPIETFLNAFPGWIALAAFAGTLIPSIYLVLLGVSVIAKRIVFNAAVGWSLAALFFASAVMLAIGIPQIVYSFKEDGEYRTENEYTLPGKTAVLKINEVGMDDYDATRLTLRGYDGKTFKVVQSFKSQGATRARGIENAQMVDYAYQVKDSTLTFDSNFKFKEGAIFRAQRLDLTLYVPFNYPFIMDEGTARFITEYVDLEDMDNQTWKMTEDHGLECIDCKSNEESGATSSLRDFDALEITGNFDLKISNGPEYAVELFGPDEEKSKYQIYKTGNTLIIEYKGKKVKWQMRDLDMNEMRINVTMPSLQKLEATGVGVIRFDDFSTEEMDIESRGPIKIRGGIEATNLTVNLTGAGEAELSGKVVNLRARLELASKLRAYNLEATDAIVEASGASSAKVTASSTLEIEEGVGSNIDYRGNPTVTKRN